MTGSVVDSDREGRFTYPGLPGVSTALPVALRPERTAVLVIDMIYGCIEAHRGYIAEALGVDPTDSYYGRRMEGLVIPTNVRLLAAARAAGVTIIYTVLGSDFVDFLDVAPNLRSVIENRGVRRGTPGFEIVDRLKPDQNDRVLTKLGSGAFGTTDVDSILRGAGIEHVVITGTVTNGCVLTTALGAWDVGYDVIVPEDGCCTLGHRLHELALDVMRGCGVTVAQADDVLDRWAAFDTEVA